jgi:PTS system nitrogen regulatory IIA component
MLVELLSAKRILLGVTPKDKLALMSSIADAFAADDPALSAAAVLKVLEDRERLASTGAGSGVAIPHGRLAKLKEMRAVLAIIPQGVDFDAIDGDPVTLAVAILGPLDQPSEHLKALARVSRTVRDERVRALLVAADSVEAALAVLADHAARF